MKVERRHQIRQDMRECSAFVYDKSSFLVGKISNLSIIGLSFEYAGSEVRTTDPMQIDILFAQYRCGIEFVGLNLSQHADLMKLLGAVCVQQPVHGDAMSIH